MRAAAAQSAASDATTVLESDHRKLNKKTNESNCLQAARDQSKWEPLLKDE
jgi:hypothetical protein